MALEAAQPGARPFSINGNGKQVRDVLFVDDAVAAYREAAGRLDACAGNVYNLGGGMANSLSLLELFREGVVAFDQMTPLGELSIRWTGDEDTEVEINDEFDGAPPEEQLQDSADPAAERPTEAAEEADAE